jgi:D-proline reductase (dithiol) PrdB
VCHQTVSLVARHIEEGGIPTLIMGCAKDIVEHCGVPRFLFSDFPLGNSAGRPFDPASQAATLELALRVLESAPAPRTTVQSPQRWSEDASWKKDYNDLSTLSAEKIAERRKEFDVVKDIARAKREGA